MRTSPPPTNVGRGKRRQFSSFDTGRKELRFLQRLRRHEAGQRQGCQQQRSQSCHQVKFTLLSRLLRAGQRFGMAGVQAGGSLAGNDSSAALFTSSSVFDRVGRTDTGAAPQARKLRTVSDADKRGTGRYQREPQHPQRAGPRMLVILTIPDTCGCPVHCEVARWL